MRLTVVSILTIAFGGSTQPDLTKTMSKCASSLFSILAFLSLTQCGLILLAPSSAAAELPRGTCHDLGWLGVRGSQAIDFAMGPDGEVYLCGTTVRRDVGTPLSFQPFPRNTNVWGSYPSHSFVARIAPDGTPRFVAYLGGSGPFDDPVLHIAVDSLGNAYVTGMANSSDFPVKNSTGKAGPEHIDTYLVKISPDGRELLYSTLLGGKALDAPQALAVNAQGEAFVAGYTSSSDFQTSPEDLLCESPGLGDHAFVAKFSSEGGLLFSRRYGPAAGWNVQQLLCDAQGGVMLGGLTSAPSLPAGTSGRPGAVTNDYSDGFVAALDALGNSVDRKSVV